MNLNKLNIDLIVVSVPVNHVPKFLIPLFHEEVTGLMLFLTRYRKDYIKTYFIKYSLGVIKHCSRHCYGIGLSIFKL